MKVKSFLVNTRLPERIRFLEDLSKNLWFSWNQDALEIFIRLGYNPVQGNQQRNYWEESYQNPVKLLSLIPQADLLAAAEDDSFVNNLERIQQTFNDYFQQTTWFEKHYSDRKNFLVAYFSCEFGLDECLPVYSGGLGILSGDHLKSASDLGIPLVGIGLLYQEGYFQQYLNNDGWQQELYPTNDWYNMPVSQITDGAGQPLKVAVQLDGDTVFCRIWRVQVGRTPLYLLDTNVPENPPHHRVITNRLYGGDRDMRIRQEIILGIGGIKALEAMNIHPSVYHINEGHSAFLSIERIRSLMKRHGLTFQEAWEIVWATNVFTTHTPVPAGNEHFSLELIGKYFSQTTRDLGISLDDFIALGRETDTHSESFCLTVLALRMSAFCNGVSKLHSETSRKMWRSLWPELPEEEIPITSVTNGIHTLTWISQLMRELLDRYLGPRFKEEPEDPDIWKRIETIPDNELWRVRQIRRERLIAFARKRLGEQLRRRGYSPMEARQAEEVLNPHALTIGFARRFAAYKRATLLFHDIERLKKILTNPSRPVQIIFAGKAHPQDNIGKEFIRKIIQIATQPEFRNHIVFIENYDMAVARYMLQGVDIWLNTPRRPLEASGTSGMKAAINGVLNVSILDGWWVEGYGEMNGWAIGSGEVYDDESLQDAIESEALYRLLEQDIIPLFYSRDRTGLPREWIKMIKSSMQTLGSYFNTHRMLIDYIQQLYIHAHDAHENLMLENCRKAREIAAWRENIRQAWSRVEILSSDLKPDPHDLRVGDRAEVEVQARLGGLKPEDVAVEVYFGRVDHKDRIYEGDTIPLAASEQLSDETYIFRGTLTLRFNGRCGYAVRVLPRHDDLIHPYTPFFVRWE